MNAELIIPGDHKATIQYAAEHFVATCEKAIQDHNFFAVALSGGSTPKALYEIVCLPPLSEEIEWEKVYLFWSDERSVLPTHHESNYRMAMDAGFKKMVIPPHHIYRMVAEDNIEANAKKYEETLRSVLKDQMLDLVMLGMGEDGHTASLFPETQALQARGRYVVANYIPQKKTWRMTLTFEAINNASNAVFYVMGESKAKMLAHVFKTKPHLPCQFVGTKDHPALWIVDQSAALLLSKS